MSEAYRGVKFDYSIINEETPYDHRMEELKCWCKIFSDKGLAPPYEDGSYGNLSFRTDNGSFIITGSKIGLKDRLKDDCFVTIIRCDFDKRIVYASGKRLPSSESMLHGCIYNARPDINAVFHGHCERISKYSEMLGIPATSKEEPYGTIELVDRVMEMLDKKYILEMRNHGFIALGRTMKEAGHTTLAMLQRAQNLETEADMLTRYGNCTRRFAYYTK